MTIPLLGLNNPIFTGPVGGKLYTYVSGASTTPLATYKNSSETNDNPTILDANGQAVVLLSEATYRFVLYDASNVLQPGYPVDGIHNGIYSSTITSLDTSVDTLISDIAAQEARLDVISSDLDAIKAGIEGKAVVGHQHTRDDITDITDVTGSNPVGCLALFNMTWTSILGGSKWFDFVGSECTVVIDKNIVNRFFGRETDGLTCLSKCVIVTSAITYCNSGNYVSPTTFKVNGVTYSNGSTSTALHCNLGDKLSWFIASETEANNSTKLITISVVSAPVLP